MHLVTSRIHSYQRRAIDLRVDVATELNAGEFTGIEFRVAELVTKTGLVAVAGGSGITIDLTLTVNDLDLPSAAYRFETVATVGGEQRTVSEGWLILDPEPTEEGP